MAAAVAMETGALSPAPRVFTEGTVLRPNLLSRFPERSFRLNSRPSSWDWKGKGGVVSQIVACVNIFAPGLLKPPTPWFPGRGGAEGEDRALLLSAFRSFSRERALNVGNLGIVLIRITVLAPLFNHFASCFLYGALFFLNVLTVSSSGYNALIYGAAQLLETIQ